ncbi:MAG: hypothetical protein NTY68_02975 [Candidatus Micrarchaeota archaeon]|nr:hypothetical protein [Candidatus Micrarchaeota archaeon]
MKCQKEKIVDLRKNKLTPESIGKEFNLSTEKVRKIIERIKDLNEQKKKGTLKELGLSTRAVHCIMKITGNEAPTLADFRDWIATHQDWELEIDSFKYGGKKIGEEIIKFAKSHNIMPNTITLQDLELSKNTVRFIMKNTQLKSPTLKNLKDWIANNSSDWEEYILSSRRSGRKIHDEIMKFSNKYNISF